MSTQTNAFEFLFEFTQKPVIEEIAPDFSLILYTKDHRRPISLNAMVELTIVHDDYDFYATLRDTFSELERANLPWYMAIDLDTCVLQLGPYAEGAITYMKAVTSEVCDAVVERLSQCGAFYVRIALVTEYVNEEDVDTEVIFEKEIPFDNISWFSHNMPATMPRTYAWTMRN